MFDKKFGKDFIKSVPMLPGVYQVSDATGVVIYVGKAKILRRRLQQYRNARRCKAHHKMRAILKAAHSIRWQECANDTEALLLENELIQRLKPHFNIAGAFSFLYPCIGLLREGRSLYLCYTTTPSEFPMFTHYGAYRSRSTTHEGYLALLEILSFIGHREPAKCLAHLPRVKFSSVSGFRQVDEAWLPRLEELLKGESTVFLENAVMALVDKPYARRHAEEVQEYFDQVARFYRFECKPLRRALKKIGLADSRGIAQHERDRVFIKSAAAAATS